MSEDEIDKTRNRILKLVHSVENEATRSPDKVSWSPFELCTDSLSLVKQVVQYSARIAEILEKKGTTDLQDSIQQFIGTNVMAAKAVLFQLLKLSYQIRSVEDDCQRPIIEYAVCLQIFEEALQELKIDAEAGYEKATAALAEVQSLVSEQMNRKGCDLDLVFDVINALNDARITIIEPIKTAMLKLGETEEMEEYHAELPTLEKMIDGLLADDKSLFEIYEILASPSRAMPLDGRYEFVNSLDLVQGDTGRDLLILTCLDQEPEVRRYALELLLKRKIKDFDAKSLKWLTCLSRWESDVQSREALATLVRKLSMAGLEVCDALRNFEKIKIVATAFDGSGCQVIFGTIQSQQAQQTFGIMFKQADGLEDAWISNHLTDEEFKSAVEHAELMPEQYEIGFDYLQVALPFFLQRSLHRQEAVPQGLLALSDILPLDFLAPCQKPLEVTLELLNAQMAGVNRNEKVLQKGFIKLYNQCYYQMWFEEGSDVERVVQRFNDAETSRAIEVIRDTIVLPQKGKWLERFKLMSVLLYLAKVESGRNWQDFYYIYQQMHLDSCPKVEEIFEAISRRTHKQMIERINQQ